MRVKVFWTKNPDNKRGRNAREFESEINAWLADQPGIRIVDIKQSASGGSLEGSLWFVSVWYEEAEG